MLIFCTAHYWNQHYSAYFTLMPTFILFHWRIFWTLANWSLIFQYFVCSTTNFPWSSICSILLAILLFFATSFTRLSSIPRLLLTLTQTCSSFPHIFQPEAPTTKPTIFISVRWPILDDIVHRSKADPVIIFFSFGVFLLTSKWWVIAVRSSHPDPLHCFTVIQCNPAALWCNSFALGIWSSTAKFALFSSWKLTTR